MHKWCQKSAARIFFFLKQGSNGNTFHFLLSVKVILFARGTIPLSHILVSLIWWKDKLKVLSSLWPFIIHLPANLLAERLVCFTLIELKWHIQFKFVWLENQSSSEAPPPPNTPTTVEILSNGKCTPCQIHQTVPSSEDPPP